MLLHGELLPQPAAWWPCDTGVQHITAWPATNDCRRTLLLSQVFVTTRAYVNKTFDTDYDTVLSVFKGSRRIGCNGERAPAAEHVRRICQLHAKVQNDPTTYAHILPGHACAQ
jgi:hypothetical protein